MHVKLTPWKCLPCLLFACNFKQDPYCHRARLCKAPLSASALPAHRQCRCLAAGGLSSCSDYSESMALVQVSALSQAG
jgi:hypothetical protein